VGRGINALGGDTKLSRGIGQGVATGLANTSGIYKGVKNVVDIGKTIKSTKQALDAARAAKDVGGIASN